jgi:hypothetical protein
MQVANAQDRLPAAACAHSRTPASAAVRGGSGTAHQGVLVLAPARRDLAVGRRPYGGPADDELRNSEPETGRLSLATIAGRSGVAGRSGHETGCGGADHRSARLPGRSASWTLAHEPAPGRAPTFATRWSRRDREPGSVTDCTSCSLTSDDHGQGSWSASRAQGAARVEPIEEPIRALYRTSSPASRPIWSRRTASM